MTSESWLMTGAGRAVHNQDTAVRQVIEWHLDNHRPEQLKKKRIYCTDHRDREQSSSSSKEVC